MSKHFKILISALLVFIFMFGIGTAAFAQDESDQPSESTLSVISANVAGLPIPSFFDDEGKVVPKTQKIMGQLLNESGVDIVCVQEDFQYHTILSNQMTNYPYKNFTYGGVPVGDGVNIFSKYPIYNVEHIAWEKFNGILDAANDGLTPKGFVKCTVDYNGILIDLYNVHSDAYGSDADLAAKRAQNEQLGKYIDENSADRPVIITGDTNVYLHSQYKAGIYEIFIARQGFKDAWTEFYNDGIYYPNGVTYQQDQELRAKFGPHEWGVWDSVERLLYRGNSSVEFEVTGFRYDNYNEKAGQPLTDHNIMVCELKVTSTDYVRPDINLDVDIRRALKNRLAYGAKMVVRCLGLIFGDLLIKAFS
ncbi:MAG: endonuclease/exonuclease/phosphatase family protein [Acutalibacteraceae bacterium]